MNTSEHGTMDEAPEKQIKTVVVSADDVVSAIQRNARDRDEQRSHVLRITPPFGTEVRAALHVTEDYTYYPPEMDPEPIHLNPDQFHDAEFGYPEQWEVHEAAKEVDGVDDIGEVSDETLHECWEVQREVWESNLRATLKKEIDLNEYRHGESHTVAVEYDD